MLATTIPFDKLSHAIKENHIRTLNGGLFPTKMLQKCLYRRVRNDLESKASRPILQGLSRLSVAQTLRGCEPPRRGLQQNGCYT
ncbi:MAG: hypothetical protein ACJAU6_001592 [Alphaproteobacteria bacterium]|jgi:hypothetical protein